MKKFEVQMPATAVINFTVFAINKEDAIKACFGCDFSIELKSESIMSPEIANFEMVEHVTTGNVCHAVQNSVDVEEV